MPPSVLTQAEFKDRSHFPVVPQYVLDLIKRTVLPEIEAAVDFALETYYRDRYNNMYVLGTVLWGNLAERLKKLAGHNWKLSTFSNDIIISTEYEGVTYSFRVLKVHPETRMPKGKSAKEERVLLLTGLEEFFCKRHSTCLNIGYDVSLALGLGSVTIDMLWDHTKICMATTLEVLRTPNEMDITNVYAEALSGAVQMEDVEDEAPTTTSEAPVEDELPDTTREAPIVRIKKNE